jgi:glycosyltransferase involved in cell wall biosynthesis
MWQALARQGHQVEVFTGRPADPEPRSASGRRVPAFLGRDPDAVVLYHHTIGWSAAVRLVLRLQCRRIVRYHNVTPAHFFSPFCSELAEDCQRGRELLGDLARADCDLYLSASAYSQEELLARGANPARCAVLPPFHHIDRLAAVEPAPAVLRDYGDGRTNLLFVGRHAPNKGLHLLIDTLAAFHARHEPSARLVLVGKQNTRLNAHLRDLRERASRLGVASSVVFVNGASEEELRAYYESAHVFVVASEHEGFCVPVVEAMALGVPVVAYGTCAVPDTVGAAGIVWDDFDPFLLAEACAAAAHDARIRSLLIERGRRRFEECFASQRISRRFLEAFAGVCAPAILTTSEGRG